MTVSLPCVNCFYSIAMLWLVDIGESKVDVNIKPEYIVSSSSLYDPIKSEVETDDEEESDKDINTSNSQPIKHIKEEGVKVEVKNEDDDVSTDDERSPEYAISSSSGYDPIKSEETDDEELGDKDTNTSNEHIPIEVVKADDDMGTVDNNNSEEYETKIEDDSTDDEHDNEQKEPVKPPAQSNTSIQGNTDIQLTTKKRRYKSKRKRELEEIHGTVKTSRIECSVEGCTGKTLDSGTCWKHKGYNYCNEEGCTNWKVNGGVCKRHGAKRKTCKHEGCTNQALKGGVCMRHEAKVKTKFCKRSEQRGLYQAWRVCIQRNSGNNEEAASLSSPTTYTLSMLSSS